MTDQGADRGTGPSAHGGPEKSMALVERQLTGVLAAWGAGSVLVGGAVWASARQPYLAAFGRQTAAWGAIDVAIAGFGLVRARRRKGQPDDDERRRLRRALMINSVLDVFYVAGGVVLIARADPLADSIPARTRGRRYRADELRGDGVAVVAQGVFLLLLDTTFAIRLGARIAD